MDEKEKIRALEARMETLVKTKIPNVSINLKSSKEWEYTVWDNTLYYKRDDFWKKTERYTMSEVLHNIGHVLYSEMFSFNNIPSPKTAFFYLLNAIEDIRAEEHMMYNYPGVFDSFLYKFKKDDSEISTYIEKKLDPHIQYIYSLARKFWGWKLLGVTPEVLVALKKTDASLNRAFQAENQEEVKSIIIDEVWQHFFPLIPDDKKEEPKEGDEKKENEGQEWDEQKKELDDSLKNSSSLGIDELMEKMKEMSQEQWEWENWEEKENFWADVEKEFDDKEKEKSSKNVQQYGQDDPVLWKNTTPPESIAKEQDSYEILYREILPVFPFFKKKLWSIMEDNRYNREGGTYRTWKLNTSRLYKFKAWSTKLFSRKIIRKHKDYYVSLLVDESGSMSSNKKDREATKATILLAEVLDKVGIPFEVRGFNHWDRVYKSFREPFTWKARRQIEQITLQTNGYEARGNNDGFAVNKASHYLNKIWTPQSERILIVLSDWLPNVDGRDIPEEDKKRLPAHKHNTDDFDLKYEIGQASKTATVIWVWIKSKHVTDYYPQNVVVNDVLQLPKSVLAKLKNNIKRG